MSARANEKQDFWGGSGIGNTVFSVGHGSLGVNIKQMG